MWARRLKRKGKSRGVWLDVPGVAWTTNVAERAHRCGGVADALARARQGDGPARGGRGAVTPATGRIRGRPPSPLLVEAGSCLCQGKTPALSRVTQHEPLPATFTP
jgi:hypothetical protein